MKEGWRAESDDTLMEETRIFGLGEVEKKKYLPVVNAS